MRPIEAPGPSWFAAALAVSTVLPPWYKPVHGDTDVLGTTPAPVPPAASGYQAMIFTTGRGNPLGFPLLPVIKVASTGRLYERMEADMDVNAGVVLEGGTLEEVAAEIKALLLRVLSGEKTKAEINSQDGILCLYTTTPAF